MQSKLLIYISSIVFSVGCQLKPFRNTVNNLDRSMLEQRCNYLTNNQYLII